MDSIKSSYPWNPKITGVPEGPKYFSNSSSESSRSWLSAPFFSFASDLIQPHSHNGILPVGNFVYKM